jgi:hypothetical protein
MAAGLPLKAISTPPKDTPVVPGSQRAEAPRDKIFRHENLVRDHSKRTGDNVDKLVGNSSLPAAIVLHLQRGDHVARIFLRAIHSIATENHKRSE